MDIYASSENNVMYFISVADLFELSKHEIDLADRLEIAKVRITHDLVDSLDFFLFPVKFLEINVLKRSDAQVKADRISLNDKRKYL